MGVGGQGEEAGPMPSALYAVSHLVFIETLTSQYIVFLSSLRGSQVRLLISD